MAFDLETDKADAVTAALVKRRAAQEAEHTRLADKK
jgi:hypothetical protein